MKRDPGCLCYITKEALKNQFLLEQGFVFSSDQSHSKNSLNRTKCFSIVV